MLQNFLKISFYFLVILIVILTIFLVFNTSIYDILSKEDHVAENLSSLFLLITSLFFFRTCVFLMKEKIASNKWLIILFALASIVFFLGFGEEISWGQRIFNIATPDYLVEINDQDEINFHNINKRFFDRVLDRLTILFVIISSVLFFLKKDILYRIKTPGIYVICSFAITPFYKEGTSLNFYHLIYIPLLVLLISSIIRKTSKNIFPLVITLLTTFFIQITHANYGHLFPISGNSANEYREFMFCFCILMYSYEIMNNFIVTKNINKSYSN